MVTYKYLPSISQYGYSYKYYFFFFLLFILLFQDPEENCMEDVQMCPNRPNSVAVNSADDEKHRPLKFTNENVVIFFLLYLYFFIL